MSEPSRTWFAALIAGLVVDVASITGSGLVVYGVGLCSRPAAFIVAGVFLLTGAWLMARRGA